MNKNLKDKRIGEEGFNTYGSKMKIIEYNGAMDITVEFESGYITKTKYECFKKGKVKNPYNKSVCGVGFFGEGKYNTKINDGHNYHYTCWKDMMSRCYSYKSYKKHPSYIGCTVCDEWHNYQIFAKWHEENYYKTEEIMCLDKDILHKGNKIYSPLTCVFVPHRINMLFVKRDSKRGNLPIGVGEYSGYKNKYRVFVNQISLGRYSTIEEAFAVYKEYKENLIKKVADEHKDKIPEKLYNAMYKYEVEITD